MVVGKEGNAYATNEIGRSIDPGIGVDDLARALEIVDQHHGLGSVGSEIVAERGTLPVDFEAAGVLGVEGAFAIAKPGNKGAAGFLSQNVAIRPSCAMKGVFHHLGETH